MASPLPVPSLPSYQKSITPELLQKYQSFKKTPRPDPSRGNTALVTTSKSGVLVGLRKKQRQGDGGQKRTLSEERKRDASVTIVNIINKRYSALPSLPHASDSSSRRLPTISYHPYRDEHLQRNNSTSPSKRRYADHSIGGDDYNPEDAAIKMYRKRTIRLTARSKVVIHSYFPPYQSADRGGVSLRRRKPPKEKSGDISKTPPPMDSTKKPMLIYEGDEPLALTYGDKLVKVQRAFNEAFSTIIN